MFTKHKIMAALLAGLVTTSVNADVLYSNGSLDGTTNALTLGGGLTVADSFNLSSNSVITAINFDTWDAFSQDVTNVDWAITSSADGSGTVYASGSQSTVTASDISTNAQGYVLDLNAFQVSSLALASGTYWLQLTNATTASGQYASWDINSASANAGSSLSWTNQTGAFSATNPCSGDLAISSVQCSSPFQVVGSAVSAVPLPSAVIPFVTGLMGMGFAGYRRLKAQA
ncbi:hypothetical protein [Methylomonas sp. AM2-LC]|uniref:hypothetical protein n=1 Tax=Methylomonas sp. AM2-LC TaxID=3153301 RepID=UPI0032654180